LKLTAGYPVMFIKCADTFMQQSPPQFVKIHHRFISTL